MTDHDIMLAVRDGDIEKLGQLFEKHNKQLYNYFLLVTKNRQASEDMVQDVFYRILKYRHTYRDEGEFKTWMFSIARNARIDYIKEHKIQYDTLEEPDRLVGTDPNPEEQAVQENDIRLVRKALENLSEDKREVIVMSRFQDMRYKEIGEVLGCSTGTVKVRIFRALRALTEKYFELSGDKRHGM